MPNRRRDKINKPVLAKCSDRRIVPFKNRDIGSPDDWFNKENLGRIGLSGFSFDFFINWRENTISNEIWIKRVAEVDGLDIQDGSG